MIIQFDVCCYMIPLANMDVSFIMSHNCYSVFGKFGVVNDIVNSFLVLIDFRLWFLIMMTIIVLLSTFYRLVPCMSE